MSNIEKIKETTYLDIIKETEKNYLILNKSTKKKYELNKSIVSSTDWENLNSVLCGRDPIILDGITRIVGYFSKISNWNKSKLGELHDRRKGNYKVG